MEKRVALRTRKCSRGICWVTASTLLPLLLSREDDRPYQRDQQHEGGDLERDRPLPEERVADRLERDRRALPRGKSAPPPPSHGPAVLSPAASPGQSVGAIVAMSRPARSTEATAAIGH